MILHKNIKWILNIFVLYTTLMADIPNAPDDYIGVTGIDKSSVRINFLDNSDNEDGFVVQGNGIYHLIDKNDETKHIYKYFNLTDLKCNQNYYIQVFSYNRDGNSTPTTTRDFNIQNTFEIPCEENIPPIIQTDKISLVLNSGVYLAIDARDSDGEIVSCEATVDDSSRKLACIEYIPNIFEINSFPFDELKTYILHIKMIDNRGATTTKDIPIEVVPTPHIDVGLSKKYDKQTIKKGRTLYIDAGGSHIGHGCDKPIYHNWIHRDSRIIDISDLLYRPHPGTKDMSILYIPTQTGKQSLRLEASCNGATYDTITFNIVDANETTDENRGITIDNLTNLMWQENNNSIKKVWSLDHFVYNTSGDTAKTYCLELDWAGYTDWRLPKIEELLSHISLSDEEHWAESSSFFYNDFFPGISSHYKKTSYDKELLVQCVRDN